MTIMKARILTVGEQSYKEGKGKNQNGSYGGRLELKIPVRGHGFQCIERDSSTDVYVCGCMYDTQTQMHMDTFVHKHHVYVIYTL